MAAADQHRTAPDASRIEEIALATLEALPAAFRAHLYSSAILNEWVETGADLHALEDAAA